MTQTAEATSGARPFAATTRAFLDAHALWIGVGVIAAAATGFLLHQLMAWPPHEDETLALFVGRDSLGGRRARHPRPRRRAAPLPLRIRGGPPPPRPRQPAPRLGRVRRRQPAADRPPRTAPRRPLDGVDRDGARRRQLGVPLPRGLRPDVQPVPLPLVALLRAPPRALDRGTWRSWSLWGIAILLAVASHPYGALVLAAQGVFVLAARRDRLGRR